VKVENGKQFGGSQTFLSGVSLSAYGKAIAVESDWQDMK